MSGAAACAEPWHKVQHAASHCGLGDVVLRDASYPTLPRAVCRMACARTCSGLTLLSADNTKAPLLAEGQVLLDAGLHAHMSHMDTQHPLCTYTSGDLVVELLQLGVRAQLGAAVQGHNGIDSLENSNVAEREVLCECER